MKKITKKDQKEIARLYNELEAAHEAVVDAVTQANAAVEDYNAIAVELNEFREALAREMADYHGERSEAWQEGETGQAYQEWADQWASAEVEEMDEVMEPGDMERELEDLPMEPEC